MFSRCLSKDHMVLEAPKGVPMLDPYDSARGNISRTVNDQPQDRCMQMEPILPHSDANGGHQGTQVTCACVLNCPLLNAGYMIPLSHCPISLEIELVPSAADVCRSAWNAVAAGGGDAGVAAGTYSTTWDLENPRLSCVLSTLSSAGQSEFDRLLSTSGIVLNLREQTSLQQLVTGPSIRANFFCAKSNIEAIYLTFGGVPEYVPQGFGDGTSANDVAGMTARMQATYKRLNFFLHPDFYHSDGNGTTAQKQRSQIFRYDCRWVQN